MTRVPRAARDRLTVFSAAVAAVLSGLARHLDLLEERGALLGEPYTRQLSGKLREMRFYCGGERVRITYWIATGRRIIALTVFAKTRMRESAEIARATACCHEARHTPDGEEDGDERIRGTAHGPRGCPCSQD